MRYIGASARQIRKGDLRADRRYGRAVLSHTVHWVGAATGITAGWLIRRLGVGRALFPTGRVVDSRRHHGNSR